MFTRIMLFLLVAVGLVGCNRDNFSAQRNQQGGVDITVTASESEVNTLIQNALAQSANPLVRNPSVDLQDGQIVISGEHDKRDGSGQRVSGTITAVPSIVNGRLAIQVTSVNIEGWDANDARIQEINQKIEEALQGRAVRDNPNVNLTRVTVTNDSLTFTISTSRG